MKDKVKRIVGFEQYSYKEESDEAEFRV